MTLSCASTLTHDSKEKVLKEYLTLYNKHRQLVCPSGTEEEFDQLLKKYRGRGLWIPELNADVDYSTIEELLGELENKLKWIQAERAKLIKRKNLPKPQVSKRFEKIMTRLLKLKADWETLPPHAEEARKEAGKKSLQELTMMRAEWKKLVDSISFLTNFKFPADHLKNRLTYDEFRESTAPTSQRIANYAFFYRKLVEDGAYNPDHTSSDSWLRTTMDTVQLELERPMMVLEEDLRYDLEYVLNRIDKELERDKKSLIARLGEWEERTSMALQFYHDLLRPESRETSRAFILDRNKATLKLKEWVSTNQAKSWLWWYEQGDTMKALYTLDTILYNEVGNVDSSDGLERRDVSQVVLNRQQIELYRTIDPLQEMWPLLRAELSVEKIQKEHWLNSLYRRGEFSFTYYYMPGAVKAFCTDRTPAGLKLQKENLKIAMHMLLNPRPEFQGLRYFSRASMPGRINMASVWSDYERLPESPGALISSQEPLRASMRKGEMKYLYRFIDGRGLEFQVYQHQNKIYVARLLEDKWDFYDWRNPHYFTFFKLKKTPAQTPQ